MNKFLLINWFTYNHLMKNNKRSLRIFSQGPFLLLFYFLAFFSASIVRLVSRFKTGAKY